MKNPFTSSIFEHGSPTLPSLHQNELDALAIRVHALTTLPPASSAPGDTLLLTASRAGAGKTHLLARCQTLTADHGLWVPLHLEPEQDLGWKEWTLALASHLHSTRVRGVSRLEEVAWFAFARLVQAGLDEGKVIAEDLPSAREQLETRFREIFAPGEPESRFHWFAGTAGSLLASCATTCATAVGGERETVAGWLRWFLAYAAPKPGKDRANRWERLASRLEKAGGGERAWKERFKVLARFASGVAPLVWTTDHLDRFFSAPQASRRLLSQLSEIPALAPRSLLILSANQDLWQQVLVPGVPGAIQDRLTSGSIHLGPISPQQAEELVAHRLLTVARADEESRAFLRRLDFQRIPASGGLTPRAILRWAAAAWDLRETLPEPVPQPADDSDPLSTQKAREKLHAVAEALRGQSGPGRGEVQPLVGNPCPSAPMPLAELFQEIRLRQLAARNPAPDWKRIQRLVSTVGQRFPSIHQHRVDPGPGTGGEALCWAIADREIFIGFAPPGNNGFWRSLTELASRPGSRKLRKVVRLTPAGETVVRDAGAEEPGGAAVEVVTIDADLAATLHAADELLQAGARGAGGLSEARLSGFLARELDFFWKQLTRRPEELTGRRMERAVHA